MAPQVLGTSATDCGPACLKAALDGYGLSVGYDRVRDACQTDVEGTSIPALTRGAHQLGLAAEQIWVPTDHLTIPALSPLPAICVTQLPGGAAHAILAWRKAARRFQIMDPSSGRRWISAAELAALILPWELDIETQIWRDWAVRPEFEYALRFRLRAVGGDESTLERARSDASSTALACLDAATRMVQELTAAGAVRRGSESRALLASLHARAVLDTAEGEPGRTVPEAFYSALPLADSAGHVRLRGAILLRLRGPHSMAAQAAHTEPAASAVSVGLATPPVASSEPDAPGTPFAAVFRRLAREGVLTPTLVVSALVGAALLTSFEVLLLRALLNLGERMNGLGQRWLVLLLLVTFVALTTGVELWGAVAVRALGRRFELRLRAELLAKLPLLGDSYFRTRPASDLAHRAHIFHPVRNVPLLAGRLLRLLAIHLGTMAGLLWLDPDGWPLVLAAGGVSMTLPWVGQSLLTEKDLEVRVHNSRLAQFSLDALLGLVPIRAHGSERAVRWEHGSIVFEWVRACKERLRLSLSVEVLQSISTTLLSVLLIVSYIRRSVEPGSILLLSYWALLLPSSGQAMASLARLVPRQRNLMARILDPIECDARAEAHDSVAGSSHAPVAVRFDQVNVRAGGRPILADVNLTIAPGEHVAIIGPSGAGKSTVLGLLLGWTEIESGGVFIDGEPLDMNQLRRRLAWVDPAVTIWGRSLLENIRYGSERRELGLTGILGQAELLEVLERMPEGLQTGLGEGGRLISGGEGQRVRLARAMANANAGLVLMDEPFRGLERPMREQLLARSRRLWRPSTLVCVTHDIASAAEFDRVMVIDDGKIVETGTPKELLDRNGRFQELLRAEDALHRTSWNDDAWSRCRVEAGVLSRLTPVRGSEHP